MARVLQIAWEEKMRVPGSQGRPALNAKVPHHMPEVDRDIVQAVPVAEPEWSAAYKGLCLYMARVLQPVWEEEIMVPVSQGSPALKANISHHMLMVCSHSHKQAAS